MKTTTLILVCILICVCVDMNIKINKIQQRITELEQLELQKDIEEYRWRKELINDIKK
mgnify:CR=1 FL=1